MAEPTHKLVEPVEFLSSAKFSGGVNLGAGGGGAIASLPWYDITAPPYNAVSGQDATTAINNAITDAAAKTYGGIVVAPPGIFPTGGGHVLPGGLVRLAGSGIGLTTFQHTAASRLFQFTAPGVTGQRASASGFSITGAGTAGIAIRDVNYGTRLEDIQMSNYTGVGLLTENYAAGQFVEGVYLNSVEFYSVTTAIQSRRVNGTNSHNDFRFVHVYCSMPASSTLWDFATSGSALLLYDSDLEIKANFGQNASTVGWDWGSGSQMVDTRLWLRAEAFSSGPTILIRLANSSSTEWLYHGQMSFRGATTSNFSIGASAVFQNLQGLPGNWGISGRPNNLFVRGANQASGDLIVGAAGYNNSVTEQAGLSNFAGFVDDGQGSLVLSGLANTRLRVGR